MQALDLTKILDQDPGSEKRAPVSAVHAPYTASGDDDEELVPLRQTWVDLDAIAPDMIGKSRALSRMRDLISQVGKTDASVLIHGESGTGKELVARALHLRSDRRELPFVAINCAAVPETLLESELFGHVAGSFTDARRDRAGLFEQADGGTLLLDEIGDMPLAMQAKLLRALQERVVRRVGAETEVPFDARILAATNRDLDKDVAAGRFREDLYYRIHVVTVEVPPLREREEDVLLLAQSFLERAAARNKKPVVGIANAAADKLAAYDWPGNVRELENCIERAVAMTRFDRLTVDDLPEKVRLYKSSHLPAASSPDRLPSMEEVERRYIQRVLEAVGHHKTRAAQILGLDRKTLYRKLKRYHLEA